jgi:hypothetical protein
MLEMDSQVESSAKVDTAAAAAITEAIRQWIKDLDAEVERINAAGRLTGRHRNG